MAASKDVTKYSDTLFELYDMLQKRDEPLEAEFTNRRTAEAFRFKCYSFKNALEHTVRKMPAEARAIDPNGYVRRLETAKNWKIKLIGSKLIFVLAIVDRSDAEEEMQSVLQLEKMKQYENQEDKNHGMTQDFIDTLPDIDELTALLTGEKQ